MFRSFYPLDTGRKLNVHKTFRRRSGRVLNVLCTFNLRPVSRGWIVRIASYTFADINFFTVKSAKLAEIRHTFKTVIIHGLSHLNAPPLIWKVFIQPILAQYCISYRNQSYVLHCKSNDWFLNEMQRWAEMS